MKLKREDVKFDNVITPWKIMKMISECYKDDILVVLESMETGKSIFDILGWKNYNVSYLIFEFDTVEKAMDFIDDKIPLTGAIKAHVWRYGTFLYSTER